MNSMSSIPSMSLDDVRADRRSAQRDEAARKAKYNKDKAAIQAKYETDKAAIEAAFEADMKALAAQLADLDAGERVLLRRGQQSRLAPNGHDRQSEPSPKENEVAADEDAEDQIEDDHAAESEVAVEDMSEPELVLAAVRRLHAKNQQSTRYHIDQFIQREFHTKVPLSNISTYLQRHKDKGLVDNTGDGLKWVPVGGPAR